MKFGEQMANVVPTLYTVCKLPDLIIKVKFSMVLTKCTLLLS